MNYKVWINAGVLIAVIMISAIVFASCDSTNNSTQPTTATDTRPKMARMEVTVNEFNYENGIYTLVGSVRNSGTAAVDKPYIKLKITNKKGDVLLAETQTLPSGYNGKSMKPGDSGVYQFFVSVPGKPPVEEIDRQIEVANAPYEVH